MPASVIMGLARSPRNIRCPLQQSCIIMVSVQTSNTASLCSKCPLRVWIQAQKDVNATAWSLRQWTPGGNVSNLRLRVALAINATNPAALIASPNFNSLYRVEAFNVCYLLFTLIVYVDCITFCVSHRPDITCGWLTAVTLYRKEIFFHRYLKMKNRTVR